MPRQRHPRRPSSSSRWDGGRVPWGGGGFIAPWEPLFVKGRSGSPDTSKGEDEFSFSAVCLPTPLILRVQMMNFFLSLSPFFFFYLFSLQRPLPLPCHGTDRAEQMVLYKEDSAPVRIESLPTPRPRGRECSEKP